MGLAVAHSTLEPTRRRVDVREVIHDLHRRYPRMGEGRLAEMLAGRIEEDRHLLLDASRLLVHQIVAVTETRKHQRKAASAPVRAARRVADQAEAKALAVRARQTILLDTLLALPNGESKQLRYATKAELNLLGGLYTTLAARLEAPDEMCGERWTEGELKALLQAV
jgi:hypothetical protein